MDSPTLHASAHELLHPRPRPSLFERGRSFKDHEHFGGGGSTHIHKRENVRLLPNLVEKMYRIMMGKANMTSS